MPSPSGFAQDSAPDDSRVSRSSRPRASRTRRLRWRHALLPSHSRSSHDKERISAGLPADRPIFALCRVMTASETAEARAAIEGAGFETLEGEMIERPGYRQAQNLGRSPTETAFTSLN